MGTTMHPEKEYYYFTPYLSEMCPKLLTTPNKINDWKEFFLRGNWGSQPNDPHPNIAIYIFTVIPMSILTYSWFTYAIGIFYSTMPVPKNCKDT